MLVFSLLGQKHRVQMKEEGFSFQLVILGRTESCGAGASSPRVDRKLLYFSEACPRTCFLQLGLPSELSIGHQSATNQLGTNSSPHGLVGNIARSNRNCLQ